MLSKKILCLLLSAATFTPAASAIVENLEPEYAEAATNFVSQEDLPTNPKSSGVLLYGCPPDINGDGEVNILDYTVFRKYFNAGGSYGNVKIVTQNADVNHDGKIDFFDLVALKDFI